MLRRRRRRRNCISDDVVVNYGIKKRRNSKRGGIYSRSAAEWVIRLLREFEHFTLSDGPVV